MPGGSELLNNTLSCCRLSSVHEQLQIRTASEPPVAATSDRVQLSDLPSNALEILKKVLADQAWCGEQIREEANIREACVKNLETAIVNVTASLRQEIAAAGRELQATSTPDQDSMRAVARALEFDRELLLSRAEAFSGSVPSPQLPSVEYLLAAEKAAREDLQASMRGELETLSRSVIAHNKAVSERGHLVEAQQRSFIERRIAQSDACFAELLAQVSCCTKELARLSACLDCRRASSDEAVEEKLEGRLHNRGTASIASTTATSAGRLSTSSTAATSPSAASLGTDGTAVQAARKFGRPPSPVSQTRSLRSTSPARPPALEFVSAIPWYDNRLQTSQLSISHSLPALLAPSSSKSFAHQVSEIPSGH